MSEPVPKGEPRPSTHKPHDTNGGGGQGGNYVFTDLDHLDRLTTKWQTIRDDTAEDGDAITAAINKIVPPAEDDPSVNQADAAAASLIEAQRHNQAMVAYTDGYLAKLTATRDQYAATDQGNADYFRQVEND